jgi:hypothetical protein
MPVYNQIVAQSVRLQAQLDDGATGRIVRATLRNHLDAFIQDVVLSEVGEGLYSDESFVMPDVPRLTAQFAVLNIDMTVDDDYSIEVDDFVRVDPISVKSSGADVEGSVEQVSDVTAEIDLSDQIIRVEAEPSVTVQTSDVKVRSEILSDVNAQAGGAIAVPTATC